jgi:ribonucleoside-diphosphate reductase alpha chain
MPKSIGITPFQSYIYKSRYARWLPDKSRREDWAETVHRYIEFISKRIPEDVRENTVKELEDAILNFEVMPSMRAMMTAGKALEKDEIAAYNCSYLAIDDPRAFDEAMYISMCGVGLGFSVERQYVNQLPIVAENFFPVDTTIKVRDSKIGWASGFRQLIALLYGGSVPSWDLSSVRPAGSPLKTFGGRASGPEPLDRLFKFTVQLFKNAAGRKLTSLECHDLMCFVADIVVSGGVRRSAMISLSNLSDDRMRGAKGGQWWIENPQRALANNSAVYTEKPEIGVFMKEWLSLYESRSGERGIYNRAAAIKKAQAVGRRKWKEIDFGVNPCGEIILRSKGLCNLTEVIVRPDDTKESLKGKIRIASILGTLQSTLTDFRYLRKDWQKNAEEERLLGVSLSGIMDCKMTSTNNPLLATLLDELRTYSVEVNAKWAEKLGINPSVAVTCVKPSGTVSQLVNCSPGIHTRYSDFLMRTIREDRKNPIGAFLKTCGVPCEPEQSKPNDVDVFYFPLASPEGSVTRNALTAVQQLELYLTYRQHWTEHNPSCTIYIKDSEWLEVAAWVYRNFDNIGGVAFLPHTDHIYKQAPYTELTEQQYLDAAAKMPVIDWSKLAEFESEDHTTAMKEYACSNGSCAVV